MKKRNILILSLKHYAHNMLADREKDKIKSTENFKR